MLLDRLLARRLAAADYGAIECELRTFLSQVAVG